MALAAFFFSVMSLLVRVAGERLPSQQIVLARAFVSLVLSWSLLRRAGIEPWGNNRKLLFLRGLRSTSATAASVLTLLEPLTSTVLAWALFGERLGPAGLLGAALLLGAMGLLLRGER